jgi:hypothetical protein
MKPEVRLAYVERKSMDFGWIWSKMEQDHYLHTMPDYRTSYEVFGGYLPGFDNLMAAALIFGRPEATRCGDWYGGVEDVGAGRCEVTRWQVLNLSRVRVDPVFQAGGSYYHPEILPGFTDRRGTWRSTLASEAIRAAVERIGYEYLLRRPPCFLDEPYEIRWLLSYCDTHLHKGTIYRAAGFELYRTNKRGIQTWRIRLPGLSPQEDQMIRAASLSNPRSIRYRAERAQLSLFD